MTKSPFGHSHLTIKNHEVFLADDTDIHPEAICFEPQLPAGIATKIYWPDAEEGVHRAVELWNKKGWHRFIQYYYKQE